VAYSIAPEDYDKDLPLFVAIKENRLLNEFFLFVLEDLHTSQGLGALKFTSDDPEFVKDTVEHVYAAIPATPTAPTVPATRAFSRQLVAYIAAFLPTAPYFKSSDSRIFTVCDDQYSSTLAMLEETADETFKAYMTRKTQGWFRRWGCNAAAASPGPGAAAALGLRRLGVSRLRTRRTARKDRPSSRRGGRRGAAEVMCHRQSWTWPGRRRRRAHAMQDFQTSAQPAPPSGGKRM
jgi:hypothetical protein